MGLSDIGTIVSILLAAGAFILTIREKNANVKKTGVDTGQVAIDNTADALALSRDAAKQVKEVREEMTAMGVDYKAQIVILQTRVSQLESELEERDAKLEALQDWAERLVHQVKSLGGTPVEMKKPKTKGAIK